jgi:hypothetical protein
MKKDEDKDKRTQPNLMIVKDVRSMYDQTSTKIVFDPWMKAQFAPYPWTGSSIDGVPDPWMGCNIF